MRLSSGSEPNVSDLLDDRTMADARRGSFRPCRDCDLDRHAEWSGLRFAPAERCPPADRFLLRPTPETSEASPLGCASAAVAPGGTKNSDERRPPMWPAVLAALWFVCRSFPGRARGVPHGGNVWPNTTSTRGRNGAPETHVSTPASRGSDAPTAVVILQHGQRYRRVWWTHARVRGVRAGGWEVCRGRGTGGPVRKAAATVGNDKYPFAFCRPSSAAVTSWCGDFILPRRTSGTFGNSRCGVLLRGPPWCPPRRTGLCSRASFFRFFSAHPTHRDVVCQCA